MPSTNKHSHFRGEETRTGEGARALVWTTTIQPSESRFLATGLNVRFTLKKKKIKSWRWERWAGVRQWETWTPRSGVSVDWVRGMGPTSLVPDYRQQSSLGAGQGTHSHGPYSSASASAWRRTLPARRESSAAAGIAGGHQSWRPFSSCCPAWMEELKKEAKEIQSRPSTQEVILHAAFQFTSLW